MSFPEPIDTHAPNPFRRSGVRRRPVTILEPGDPADGEGLVSELIDRGPGIRVDLLLDDGTEAVAFLPKLDVAWLDLRVGDIVPIGLVSA